MESYCAQRERAKWRNYCAGPPRPSHLFSRGVVVELSDVEKWTVNETLSRFEISPSEGKFGSDKEGSRSKSTAETRSSSI